MSLKDTQRYLWLLQHPVFAIAWRNHVVKDLEGDELIASLERLAASSTTPPRLAALLRDAARPLLLQTGRTKDLWARGLFAVALADIELGGEA